MLKSTFSGIRIAAIACAVPTKTISSEVTYKKFGKEFTEKTEKTIGIKSIRKSVKKQIASDLGYVAAERIIEQKNIDRSTIGVIVYVTQSPDYNIPATSCVLHKRLGLPIDCAAVDVNNGCPGFVYGVQIICSMLNSLSCERALLIVGDSVDKKDTEKFIPVPFGDGTGAALFEKCSDAPTIEVSLRTDGSRYLSLITPFGGLRGLTYTEEELKVGYRRCNYALMNGIDVFNFSITDVPEHINQFVKEQGRTISDYDCVALHQPNLFMIKQIVKKIGAKDENVPISLDRFGNTNGGSIPLTLVDRYGNMRGGGISVLMSGFGVGLMWGIVSAEILIDDIFPMIFSDDYFEDPELDTKEYD